MSKQRLVVKVGGSLYDLADLRHRLTSWLTTLPPAQVVLIPGGGAAADFVRDLDRVHGLGETVGHWLALRALTLTAQALAEILKPHLSLPIVTTPNDADLAILDLYAFSCEDEAAAECLPKGWSVTTDSLAARVAQVWDADALILLKSVTLPERMSWAEATHLGYVDAHFPIIAPRIRAIQTVNLRDWTIL